MWLEKQSFISFTWQTATKVISGGILSKIFLQTFLNNFTWKIKRLWKLDFSKFSGDPCISKPNRVHRHRWLTDPFTLGTWSYPSINSSFKVLYALHLNLELSILECTVYSTLGTWSYPSFHSSFRALYIYINSTYTKDKIINFSERLDFSS